MLFRETSRLLLYQPREIDLDPIGDLWTDPQVTVFVGGPREREEVLVFFREYVDDFEAAQTRWGDRWWTIVEGDSGRFVGLVALVEKEIEGEVEIELNYFLVPSAWGKGYATEAARAVRGYAFEELDLPSIVALINPENEASRGVATKVGMGLDRELVRPGGSTRQLYRVSRRLSTSDVAKSPDRSPARIDQRDQEVEGAQTNVGSKVSGSVISGEFDGPVATGGGEAVDMRGRQGALYKPEGSVDQHFGDRYEIRDIDGEVNLERTNIRFGNVTGGEINIGEGERRAERCRVCGHRPWRAGAKFCNRCGAELE